MSKEGGLFQRHKKWLYLFFLFPFCKKSFLQGEGAGAEPTATSVISDLLNCNKLKLNCNNFLKLTASHWHYDSFLSEENNRFKMKLL